MFLRFINRKSSVTDLLVSFSRTENQETLNAVNKVMGSPPDLESFRKELEDAVRDIVRDGPGPEFKAFVDHYMEPSLVEKKVLHRTPRGDNRSQVAYVKDENAPWIQGFICYNLCLYIKAFGLDSLKVCKVCDTVFSHKGKYAAYCSDACKKQKPSPSSSPKSPSPFPKPSSSPFPFSRPK